MDVSLTQLRTLRELERLGTMAAVAASLGYTHGAISQQLANLERAVEFELTVKYGRRVILTDAGATLARYADSILTAVDDAEEALRATREGATGPVRLGTFATTAAALLPATVQRARELFPDIRLTSREVEVDAAGAAVRRGDVDIALGLDYSNAPIPREEGIDHILLRSESFSLAMPAGYVRDLDAAAGMDLADAASWDWIIPPISTQYGKAAFVACRLAGFEPRVVHEVTDTAASLSLVSRGLGVTFVTPMMRALVPSVTLDTVELRQDIQRHVILARRRDPVERRSIDAIVDVLHDVVESFATIDRMEPPE